MEKNKELMNFENVGSKSWILSPTAQNDADFFLLPLMGCKGSKRDTSFVSLYSEAKPSVEGGATRRMRVKKDVIPGSDPESINADLNQKAGLLRFARNDADFFLLPWMGCKVSKRGTSFAAPYALADGVAARRMRAKISEPLTRISSFRSAQAEIQPSPKGRGIRAAFTLAEVLITLGIIGVVAAMTLPSLIQNYQKKVLQNQFKKSYSLVQQALRKSEADLDYKPDCYYWDKSPYSGQYWCVEWHPTEGYCTKYNNPRPSNYNGDEADCTMLRGVMEKNLKIVKTCANNAYSNNCIPDYAGNDTIKKDNNPDISDYDLNLQTRGCAGWRKNEIKNSRRAIVLVDGTIILYYTGYQLFAIDVNGSKKPNKWGYDIFEFTLTSNPGIPLKLTLKNTCGMTEKGGTTSADMLMNSY